ncbi:MAG TPA: hypothetical protein VN688_01735 [Gemmataceae bacterium]|nr:hypothetical protein [Gemmataceae bacterium]
MLDIILSHWLIYLYVSYVIVLIVLCVAFPPRLRTLGRKLREFHSRRRMRIRMMKPDLRIRQLR